MQYEIKVFGYNFGVKTHLANAYYSYESQQSLVEIVERRTNSWYRTASRKPFLVSEMYCRAQNAIKRIATVDSPKYEYRYVFDYGTNSGPIPVACIVLDTETGWHGASFVNPTPVYRTEMRQHLTQKGVVLRQHVIKEQDVFQYTIARERAIENIGRLAISNRMVGIGSRKEKLSTIVNDIINDWDLA